MPEAGTPSGNGAPPQVTEGSVAYASLAELRALLDSGDLGLVDLAQACLDRIAALDHAGPTLRSIIETSPSLLEDAAELERSRPRGPLHGMLVLLKDNIDTVDATATTAGSLALMSSRPRRDAFVVRRLGEAGALILGKANMSEWANFRSSHSSSGWSARGGQARNPYVLDRSPCGSSSGSASAVAAGLVPLSLGTETNGSILCPAAVNGVVGIKPTVGLTSRSGVVPISHTQDTVGPFARTVADAALLLSVIAGPDAEDPAAASVSPFSRQDLAGALRPDGLTSARIGVARESFFGYSPKTDAVIEESIVAMRNAGATLVDPADIPTARELKSTESEFTLLLYEFKHDLAAYLQGREGTGPKTLADVIAFNEDHRVQEMPYFEQELMVQSEAKGDLSEQEYVAALDECRRLSRTEGIDAVLEKHQLDALVMPTTGPAFCIDLINGDHYVGGASSAAAMAGYPAITVPAGEVSGLPVGLTFVGRAFSELTLLRLAYAFEQATQARFNPEFLPTLR